ncbi:MAG TPA: YggS family pyridoxal phosphate-dependent enzyme [Ruminococcus sp.]
MVNNKNRCDDIQENLRVIRENIAEACSGCGRDPDSVEIMAVTKTVPPEIVNSAIKMGIGLMGENRVQEFLSKQESYVNKTADGKPVEIHFIGRLQTNKVKYIIDPMCMIQSVDSIRLAKEISRLALAKGKVMDILCEVNIGGEESKGGIAPDGLAELLEQVTAFDGVRLRGLMTIPPPSESDIYLGRMGELYDRFSEKYGMDVLSMGMTGDYVRAVKYGSTIVRIGTGLFGTRN